MFDFIKLSNQTLLIFAFVAVMACQVIMIGYTVLYPKTKGLKIFMLGNVFLLLFYVTIYMDGYTGTPRFSALSNLLDVLVVICFIIAFKRIIGVVIRPWFYIVAGFLVYGFGIYFFYYNNSVAGRRGATSIIIAILLFEAFYNMTRKAKEQHYRSFIFSGTTILLFASYNIIRAIYRIAVPITFKTVFDENPSVTVFILLSLVFAVMMNFAVTFLTMDCLMNQIQFLSDTDSLTKIYNRRYFMNHMEENLELYKRKKNSFAIVLLDIDDFKEVNDLYGHNVGDEVLVELSAYFVETLRKIDIVARYGGEEFIMLIRTDTMEQLQMILKRIHMGLKNEVLSSKNLTITISGGAVLVGETKRHMRSEDIIDVADKRLYYAKETGKDKIIVNAVADEL